MKAIILCGGKGMRMRPLTLDKPKCLVEIKFNDTVAPILEHQLQWLSRMGIEEIYLAAGYKTDKIEKYLEKTKRETVKVISEEEPLGTAGAVRLVRDTYKLKGYCVILNGDILTDYLPYYPRKPLKNTLITTRFKCPYGVIKSSGKKIYKFEEKPFVDIWVNAGIYIIDLIKTKLPKKGSLEMEIFPKMLKNNEPLYEERWGGIWKAFDNIKEVEESFKE